jgi:hypothetical protein
VKPFSTLLLAMILVAGCRQTTRPHLFPIVENNRVGFIDTSGQVVIKPVFRSAGEFSEGLAAERLNGTYGYIDETGKFVIQPQFDYAEPFSDGLAIVYKDGQPYFINKQGQKAFDFIFSSAEPFENGRAKVKTANDAFGFIDKHGKLLIDTIFLKINPFIQGMAVVNGINHRTYDDKKNGIKKNNEVGVIDTLGHFIIPYGKYEDIGDFENGYFKIEIPKQPWDTIEGNTRQTGFIDKTGKLVLAKDHKNSTWITGNMHDGLAKIYLYKYWVPEEKGTSSSINSYQGFINLKGEITINDTTYESVMDFSNNRAFIQNKSREFFIINTEGKRISNEIFSNIVGNGFNNGYAIVKKEGLYGMIDTNARFLIKPQFNGVDETGVQDGYFFYYGNERLYGIAKTDGRIVLKPVMDEFDRNGFQNGMIKCTINKKLTYINKSGIIVWQEKENKSKQLANLNTDCMTRGHFYAYSKPNEEDPGGFGGSNNFPVKISNTDKFPANTLSIVVRPNLKDTIYGGYNGITVFIANTSKRKLDFNASDSRLYMTVQAKNARGEWKDIEYLPSSFCGNSYHTLTLEPMYYWKFLTPVYEGDLKTTLRIQLTYIDPEDRSEHNREKKQLTLYSNEYEGRINPGQCWREPGYTPMGIMDPYNN